VKYIAALAAVVAVLGGLRWSLLATRGKRLRHEDAAQAAAHRNARSRLVALVRWPLFLVLYAAVVVLGLLAGMLVGRQ
jgi:hypothetical protein